MTFQHIFARPVSAVMTFVLMLGLFAFVPLAHAAQVEMEFSPVPDSEYKIHEGGNFHSTVAISNMTDDVNVHFYVKGPLGEPGEAEELIESHWYISPGEYTFVWDGKMSGGYVPSGTYEIRMEGDALIDTDPDDITHEVEVEGAAHFTVTGLDDPYYTTSGSDFEMNVHLDTLNDSCPRLRLGPTGEPNETAEIQLDLTTGDYIFTWNGEYDGGEAPAGEYTYHLFNDLCGYEAEVMGTFMVSNDPFPAAPAISGLGMTIDPFSPDDDGNQDTSTVTFDLDVPSPYTEADVTISIENESNVEVRKLKDEETTSAGTVNAIWDGKETGGSIVSDGTYTVIVTASTAGGSDTQETTVEVDTSGAEPEPEDACAGYSDVPASHPDCDAIEYVQSIGAMTGNPDGTFAPNEVLQRDQVAKISLETFDLFNDAADYCDGTAAFPDVTSSQWSYQYICRGVDLDMITGYESGADAGFYRPARSVNRVEFLALILRNVNENMPSNNSSSYNDVPQGEWYSGYAKYAYDHSLFVGNNLNPTQQVTRVEVAEVLLKLHDQGKI